MPQSVLFGVMEMATLQAVLQNIYFFGIFDQINKGLMSKTYAMFKNIKHLSSFNLFL